jgi:phosphohistidine phosphatase SixA
MIRIQPELIICSPAVRTRQTAEGVRDALHEHGYGEIEIREDDRVLIGSNDYTYLLEECRQSGKRVLVVSHKPVCEGLWTHQLGSLREGFGYGEVVRLPLIQLKNELDRRIMAELHKTIRSVDQALHLYDLEEATNQLVAFIDQLTNWYVRRSRRRFRSEGMEDDKVAAYTILYEVVMTYLKLLAPFAPFVTEKIWLDLQAYTHTASLIKQVDGEEMFASVHHQYRPLVSEKYIDQQLIKEIATVRKIIK